MTLFDAMYATTAFGVSAIFTPAGGSGSDVTVMINEDPDLAESGGSIRRKATIQVRQSEVETRPTYRSTFLVGSDTWTIVDNGVQELASVGPMGGEWLCHCSIERVPL